MRLLSSQIDEKSLSLLGEEAKNLLSQRSYNEIASRYGYALAQGRNLAEAIESDFESALSRLHGENVPFRENVEVRYLSRNDANLHAVISFVAAQSSVLAVVVELVVTNSGAEKHVTLEDISVVSQ